MLTLTEENNCTVNDLLKLMCDAKTDRQAKLQDA